uniref:non-specific serine/threonine protein kinase n=1 Tax=viral metagenome TaxID=1070528 RepID=A0A6C0HI67_9ZZZZ
MDSRTFIANKYVILEEIGRGNFGIVHKGEHVKSRMPVAIKMEPAASEYNTIKYEATILNYLYNNGCRVIPSVLWYGIYRDYKCLTMDYCDQTVQKYLQIAREKSAGSPFDYLKHVINIITNMVGIVAQVHKHQIIHRDIKPENFMIKGGELYIIDFGIASAVSNLEEIAREPSRETIIGSPKYISYFVHQGYEPMYRDDLISVGYCFFYFVLGSVPWTNISISLENNTQHGYQEIHVLHEKNQIRKKWKEWKNIEKILDSISKTYIEPDSAKYTPPPGREAPAEKISPDFKKLFMNIFEYFALCYNMQLDERPFYEELCQVLQKVV